MHYETGIFHISYILKYFNFKFLLPLCYLIALLKGQFNKVCSILPLSIKKELWYDFN